MCFDHKHRAKNPILAIFYGMLKCTVANQVSLNKEQERAVKTTDGPLLIIAGAGTGKTTVVAEHIKHLVISKTADPSEILALTFTEKAAREMEERVDVALPYGYTQMWIMTFHSFCDRILRREALHIGLDPRYKLMTQAESVQLISKNLFKLKLNYFRPLGNPAKFVYGMLQHFSRLQDEDCSPLDYVEWVKAKAEGKRLENEEKIEIEKWKELAEAYKDYDELKIKDGLFDFGDLIIKTLKLFRDRPNILKEYQRQFKYILVDEFQDTNFAQNELIKLLTGKRQNIMAVGDDDQSIYKFRGAAVSNIIQFRKNYPKARTIVLTKNYRSSQEILDKSYNLIQFNNPDRLEVVEKVDKKLIAQGKNPPSRKASEDAVEFIHSDRVENEADEIAKKIKILVNSVDKVNSDDGSLNQLTKLNNQLSYKDIAVLVRANNHAEPIMRAFARHSIPFQYLGPGRLFRQPEIVDLISFLRVLYNFEDSVSFFRFLSQDFFKISGFDIAKLGNYAKKYNLSLFEAAEKVDELSLSSGTKTKVHKILDLIKKYLDLVKKESAGQILYFYLEETGLLGEMLSPKNQEAEKVAKNVSKFFDKLKTYEVDHTDSGVSAVVEWLDLSMELGESPLSANEDWTDINAVNILTVHSAKGLEFPVVFLVNLVAQRFPTIERREQIPIPDGLIKEILPTGDFHLQEERRLFYVGMTRAKERLYFTAADYYGEGKREKKLSPFVYEALGNNAVIHKPYAIREKQLSFLDFEKEKTIELKTYTTNPKVDYLSYSQIEAFRTCPLHYKLRYIYKLPTPPSASQSFGTTIHATLEQFYKTIVKNNRPLKSLIFGIFDNNWVKEGYKDKSQEKEFYNKGKVYLTGFLENFYNPKLIPAATELPFIVPVNYKLPARIATQSVIGGQITDDKLKPLKIGGKIDRVDSLEDGTIEIIDYKTGATIPNQKDVDKNLQLSFYALAATKIPTAPFGQSPDKVKLSLYFLDTQEKISTTRSVKQLEEAEKEIFKVRDEIEKSDFKCSGHMFCQNNCEYSLFCKSD